MFLLKERQEAIKWIEDNLCDETRLSVQEILDGAKKFLETGERIKPNFSPASFGGDGFDYFGDFEHSEEFWKKYEIITGEKLPDDKRWERDYFIECCA